MSASRTNTRSQAAASRRRPRRYARRGVVALLAIWATVIFLVIAAWVLNYNLLVLVNRNMQQKCDAIALSAAPALLDEDLLRDYPGPAVHDQTDDLAEAREVADQYRRWNNQVQVQSRALDIRSDDMTVESGYVADITGDLPYLLNTSIALDDPICPHNTLKVHSRRLADGDHPVRFVLDLFHNGGPRAAEVRLSGYATLDDLLVGFRPQATVSSPVMPLGIDVASWNTERATGGDSNTNRVREIVLRLDTPDPDSIDANAALLFFDGTLDVSVLLPQMALGLLAGDLPPDGVLGPVTETVPQSVMAMRRVDRGTYPSLNAELAWLLNNLAATDDAKRVFPLYETFADADLDGIGAARLVGFVGASVMFAGVIDDRLTVTVEPCFIIHHTAWTVGPRSDFQPKRNAYIHKLRLTR